MDGTLFTPDPRERQEREIERQNIVRSKILPLQIRIFGARAFLIPAVLVTIGAVFHLRQTSEMYSSKHGVDDMVMLTKVNNDGITDNLKKRHAADVIYTYIGHVLISVNPFKEIKDLYTDRTLKDYKGKYRYELPPHVYSLADDMYRSMLNDRENQCVIISGESGAGKTEASKKIMQFIAAVSGNSPSVTHVKNVIIESNPLLEAFGNAKTLRNNNSSRFGKYMEIQFDLSGDPQGGRVNNYLLEKSRVCGRSQNERSFHIFYQLIAGADSSLQSELGLSGPDYFNYLSSSRCYQVDGIDDKAEFMDTMKSMNTMGIAKDAQHEVLRLLAGILYLGNIVFVHGGKGDESKVQDPQVVDMFAHLIQSDSMSCTKALLFRTIQTGTAGKSARVSTYDCPNNVEAAEYSRDALAKALYTRLFDWIVMHINSALGWIEGEFLTLGILDIYGFEIFEKNGFEQFCINYVNERLQQIFIQLTLKAEQEEYDREGIKWEHIDFFNNKICCDLIESKKPIGILVMLDDVCNFPKGSDEKFLQKLCESYTGHAHFSGGMGAGEFIIKHYAGEVVYNTDGFCDKNRDLLVNDLIDLAHCTQSWLIQDLFPEAKTIADKRRPTSAGFKIKESINQLVAALEICAPHYIRCIKPNEKKQAGGFDNGMVHHQVKYLGLLENIRVRRAGYAFRQFYDKFFYRYRVCSSQTWPNYSGKPTDPAVADAILSVMNLEAGQYQKGKTKVFIRAPETLFALEELRERKVYSYANSIQRFFLQFSMNNYFYNLQMTANSKVQGKKERRRLSLERPFKGDYINYRENFPLKAMIERNGKEKMGFADRVNKYTRSVKKQRRLILITDQAVYLIAIDKNKDKDKVARAKKPWLYVEKRRLTHSSIRGISFSTLGDNFFVLHVPGSYDSVLECRRKTEMLSLLLKYNSGLNIAFSDNINFSVKENKQGLIGFAKDPTIAQGQAKPKGKRIMVGQGLPASTTPNIKPPAAVPVTTQQSDPYGRNRGGGAAAAGGARGPQSNRGNPSARAGAGGVPRGGAAPRAAPRPAPGGAPPPSSGPQPLRCEALYEFEAENPDELSFGVGATIEVIKQEGEWWIGSYQGREGMFPATYVKLLPQSAPSAGGAPRGAPRGAPMGAPAGGAPRGAPMGAPRGAPMGAPMGAPGGAPRGAPMGAPRGAPPGAGGAPRGGPGGPMRGAPPGGAPPGRGAPPSAPRGAAPPTRGGPAGRGGPPGGFPMPGAGPRGGRGY
ncbi:hypothetical protein PROFUN_12279 [Planoprotostelium fungivorum]|uniref:Uncharacterized protein n=1 Tax=Planoprotostelium fungivorum TaxID=1890364 RepID=A0A2P6N7R3_9EUKA|nr:hypothetical protein PROFUN_12279 [Planoprotostelium fungivorum]